MSDHTSIKESEESGSKSDVEESRGHSDQGWPKRTLESKFAFLFLNDVMSDVIFTFEHEADRELSAHKFILSIGSPEFKEMFTDETKKEVAISHTELDAFKEFLRYLYTDECYITIENAGAILNCSRKYKIPLLTRKCIYQLSTIINNNNAFHVMSVMRNNEVYNFYDECWNKIKLNPTPSYRSSNFEDLDPLTLTDAIVNSPHDCGQVILEALTRWVNKQLVQKPTKTNENKNLFYFNLAMNHFKIQGMSYDAYKDCVNNCKYFMNHPITQHLT
eukprot:TRINITY_DN4202_c0_g1_i4.p1 TRINITY_DN4202_c0_g1~~TRINITY_DN4202_c0_g1_i4.p1  ORF type:complete len:275 (-),score=4.69 TRINITY_DN4202_c0_g1_i4:104-928(-)